MPAPAARGRPQLGGDGLVDVEAEVDRGQLDRVQVLLDRADAEQRGERLRPLRHWGALQRSSAGSGVRTGSALPRGALRLNDDGSETYGFDVVFDLVAAAERRVTAAEAALAWDAVALLAG